MSGDSTANLPNFDGTIPVFTTAPTSAITDGTAGQFLKTDGAGALSFTTVFDTDGNLIADGGNLILGDEALSIDSQYIGMKTSYMTGTSDYMILSGTTANSIGDTFISAKTGSNVFIRSGGNDSTHQIEIQSGQAKAHGILSVVSTALVGNADFGSYNSTHGNLMVSNGANPTSILLYNDAGSYHSGLVNYHNNILKLGLNNANTANTLLTTTAINVNATGVGIGTDGPSTLLHVNGGSDANVTLTSASNRSGIMFHKPGTTTIMGSVLMLESGESFRLGTASHYHVHCEQDGKTFINTTANFVRIGSTTAPSCQLDVTGEIRASNDVTAFYSSDRALKENINIRKLENAVSLSFDELDSKRISFSVYDSPFSRCFTSISLSLITVLFTSSFEINNDSKAPSSV